MKITGPGEGGDQSQAEDSIPTADLLAPTKVLRVGCFKVGAVRAAYLLKVGECHRLCVGQPATHCVLTRSPGGKMDRFRETYSRYACAFISCADVPIFSVIHCVNMYIFLVIFASLCGIRWHLQSRNPHPDRHSRSSDGQTEQGVEKEHQIPNQIEALQVAGCLHPALRM